MICACIDTSKAEIGSSHITSFGFEAKALAMPSLCLCPPENSWGIRSRRAGSTPTASKSSATRLSYSSLEETSRFTFKTSPTKLPAVCRGSKEP